MSLQKITRFVCFLWLACTISPLATGLTAEGKPIERDLDGDGKIDQVAYVDRRGNPIRLTIDSNADGVFDKTQFYQGGKIVRIESDRDFDGQVDTRDLFEKEKRVRHERMNAAGRIEPDHPFR